MPLRSGGGTITTPPPVHVPTFPTPAPPRPAQEYYTWTPNGGPTLILSAGAPRGIHLGGLSDGRSIIGLDMPPQEEHDTQLPGGGEQANGRRWAARQFALPVVIHADTVDGEFGLRTYRRELMAAFNPARGEGAFTVAYPDGTRRHLNAKYSSGLDTAELGRVGYPFQDAFMIVMRARDPFPYGDEQQVTFDPPETYEFFAPEGDPEAVVYISSSTGTGDRVIEIDGEEEVHPVWTLTGPMTTATLRNRDTGKTLTLNANLTAGQKLIIRTDPTVPSAEKITNGSGANRWAQVIGLSNFPNLWKLRPGSNRVTVTLNGAIPNATSALLTYRPRYLVA